MGGRGRVVVWCVFRHVRPELHLSTASRPLEGVGENDGVHTSSGGLSAGVPMAQQNWCPSRSVLPVVLAIRGRASVTQVPGGAGEKTKLLFIHTECDRLGATGSSSNELHQEDTGRKPNAHLAS